MVPDHPRVFINTPDLFVSNLLIGANFDDRGSRVLQMRKSNVIGYCDVGKKAEFQSRVRAC